MAFDPKDPKSEKLDSLERNLYSRDAVPVTFNKRPNLTSTQANRTAQEKMIEYGWKQDEKKLDNDIVDMKQASEDDKKTSFATKIFLFSVLFFVIAAGIAAYIILGGFNVISSKNVDVSIRGLVAVAAGEPASLDVIIKNENNSAIESGMIYIEYPEGTRLATDVTQELTRDQFQLPLIPSGDVYTTTIKPVFFGEQDAMKQIKVNLDYKARGSNASFFKEKTFDITISSSPITMTVDVPEEVNAGQDIELVVDVVSNSNTLIRNLVLKAEFPFGFSFVSASPAASLDNMIWNIGDLAPTTKRTITIRGRMEGQNEEERTFRFSTGTVSPTDDKQLAVNYITSQATLAIKKPFIGLGIEFNGKAESGVTSAGDMVSATLEWSNNLPVAINDAQIEVKLSGKGFDRSKVSGSMGGFYRSVDNTLQWDQNSLSALRRIEPGQRGSVNFTFGVLPSTQQLLAQGRNMDVTVDAVVIGTRVQSGSSARIQSRVTNVVKVGTNAVIAGRVVHSTGPFTNTGPVPPRAEQKTTYTIILNASNSFNDLANLTLSTQLPQYVRWVGRYNAQTEQVSYDESTRTVSWTIPELRAGVGYTSASKEVAFQVELLPSLTQVGTVPTLTGPITSSGTDKFTGKSVESSKPALTTRMTTDTGVTGSNNGEVRN